MDVDVKDDEKEKDDPMDVDKKKDDYIKSDDSNNSDASDGKDDGKDDDTVSDYNDKDYKPESRISNILLSQPNHRPFVQRVVLFLHRCWQSHICKNH